MIAAIVAFNVVIDAAAELIAADVIVPIVVRLPPMYTLPVTVSDDRLLRLVMLANVPGDNVPLNVPPVIVPGTVRLPIVAFTVLSAADVTLPVEVMLPFTVALLIVALTALND